MDSGDIHLMGRRVTEAWSGGEVYRRHLGKKDPELAKHTAYSLEAQDPQTADHSLSPGTPASATVQGRAEARTPLTFVVVLVLNVAGQAEVPQLHTLRGGHQDVSDGDVPGKRT